MISLHTYGKCEKIKRLILKVLPYYIQICYTENCIHMEIFLIKLKRQLQLCRAYNTRTRTTNEFVMERK